MKTMRASGRLLFGLVTMIAIDSNARAEPLVFQSSENRVALLELFTSEGCSSCPPAETWLSGLSSASGLWKDFVPVSFHVDYWDYLGWRDPWGSKAFSERQRTYAQTWRSDSIYTPGFVLNGKEWRSWSRENHGPAAPGTKAGVLRVSSADGAHWHMTFSAVTHSADDYEAHAAILANGLISDVKAGENRGRRLKHDFVVTAFTTYSLTNHGDKAEGEFELSSHNRMETDQFALAVWATRRGSLEPLQALGGWLPHPPGLSLSPLSPAPVR